MQDYKKIKMIDELWYAIQWVHQSDRKTIDKFLKNDDTLEIPKNTRKRAKLIEELKIVKEFLEDGEALDKVYREDCERCQDDCEEDCEEECAEKKMGIERAYDGVLDVLEALKNI